MSKALTGVNEESFTRLAALKDGTMENILDLLGSAMYDDTQLAQDVAANTSAIATKRHIADSYTKAEVDAADALKRNAADSYTKTEVDAADALKRNIADSYTKAEVDTAAALKRNAADSYTR